MATRAPPPPSSRRTPAQPEATVMIGDYERLNDIGKGSFAMVYRGIHRKKGTLVAIKSVQLYKLSKKLRENLYAEIRILQTLHHPHIVGLVDCNETSQHIHIIMEFCELGDLSGFIKGRATLGQHEVTAAMMKKYPNPPVGGLNEVIVRHFLKQMASALEFLRAKNYVHRDIKPQNLLLIPSPEWYVQNKPERMPLTVDENSLVPAAGIESLPMLKIADFGFARVLPQTSLAETLCGSPLYMAPEILRYEEYDAKADLWSVGTVLYEMMVGKPPFRANNHVELLRKIEKQDDRIKFPEGFVISDNMKRLIRSLLKKSPTERMDYERFFQNTVVRDEIPGLVGEDRPSEPKSEASLYDKREGKRPEQFQPTQQEQYKAPQAVRRYSHSKDQASSPRTTSRPSSIAENSRTSPRPASRENRHSQGAAPVQVQQPLQRERRPTITSHATAPARQELTQDRAPAAAAIAIERHNSRVTPSPASSMLKEHFDRERGTQRADDKALREARERVAQDIAFERDYVLVEKRAVEVNALADELAASPQLHGGFRERPTSPQRGAMIRRATTQAVPASAPGPQSNMSRAMAIATGKRPDQQHHRSGSYERRYGPSPTSATSAISKALNMANFRLFGMGFSPPSGKRLSPPQGYGAFPTYPAPQAPFRLIGNGGKELDAKDEDIKIVLHCEELATRSDVVYGFAEIKYIQLLPVPPAGEGLGIGVARRPPSFTNEADLAEDDILEYGATVEISEEALVLYVKALSILTKVIDIAGSWWTSKNRGEVISDSPRSTPLRSASPAVSNRLNNVVQWARNRFNECLEKSEFVGRKLVATQRRLPEHHPGHPNNHPATSVSSANSVGSAENITLTTGITAEKLLYDRALEMSRQAAVNELVNEDLEGCEMSYRTAVHMLDAILDSDDDQPSRKGVSRSEDDLINGLETEDRATVLKILQSMKGRLNALKRKLEIQKATKRASIPSAPPGHHSNRTITPTNATPPK